MGAPLFLVDALPDGERVTLAGPEGHHAATVQRLRVGEKLLLGDGRGATATAVVTGVGRSTLELAVTGRRRDQPPLPRLVVAQAIAKGDRGELAVQAMTEVGVDEVVPWPATRSVARWRGERGERAWHRWIVTAREAAKQARRPWLPSVAPATPTPELAARLAAATAGFVLHEEAKTRLTEVSLPDHGEVVLVVGPEGGVSPKELAAFEAAGAVPVRLGSTVLRTSTAGVAALSVLNVRLGRW
ncbi:MAG TPA: 16S rRNA (uracil(1498)-N(3))-methyltransferase [Natronosporangium sp.]|nr:16S rRNA (uracil(1498)-N(3))-methyltransferase [Natronosporangium sp.]